MGLKQYNTVKYTFCRESLAVIRKDACRINIFIHLEIGGRWPEVITNMYTLEVALAEKICVFNNITSKEFTYKQESRFPSIKFQASCALRS